MRSLIRRLWLDCRGEVQISAALLLCIVVGIGTIVGLVTLRDQIVQEFGDIAVSLESLNQSYSTDTSFYLDPPTTLTDPDGAPPADLDLNVSAAPEA